jgi:hypothetical protein
MKAWESRFSGGRLPQTPRTRPPSQQTDISVAVVCGCDTLLVVLYVVRIEGSFFMTSLFVVCLTAITVRV